MSRESRIIKPGMWGVEKTIYHYESFGWELLSLNGDRIVMSRETQGPVYDIMVRNELKYIQLINDYRNVEYPEPPTPPAPFSVLKCFGLFLLFIIPGFRYMSRKSKEQRQAIKASNRYHAKVEKCDQQKKDILDAIEKHVLDSRATFFGKTKA